MSETLNLLAKKRDRAGKGASRAIRREGLVPAVIYGDKTPAVAITVEEIALFKMLNTGHFMNSVVTLTVDGKKIPTLPKDVQFHPVTDRALHVDFLRVSATSMIEVAIPVSYVDEEKSPGIKRGGVLNIIHHELKLKVKATDIPEQIEVSVEGLEVGDSIHINQLKLPAGVELAHDEHEPTVATIIAPSGMKSSENEEAEEAEATAEEKTAE
ncbi:MAG: 50S ribosomal protein L25/general stress protein Ctc [Zymomonas mobilis subsp. pomaceae]|uniref:Large ribosomal subunit protein bL25 n=1 Tax=Zymomonas mobilis subsp. pomaceae (strain ATCC 29192 / DSM 22645 / JCM 10191 / CCUG 17912 / NBRC 13757 / NCIMB 11200 / NRRL B-4491 / Barker I) TaxID=579138 RepID=F8EU85_ZYMMT|nr:50S ribosomal protein L25/general stress protein Ctc [Zymomonas mobilis]AEI38106.1 ribosomal 5S rRNA E-loop binding protein Ctc/L25/TL5 [Zymomonas mobilis subsp. pomaceae ATCC 29192]MDX5949472.1 50S ribosomal protein L25/general stress protein Ctc [Zymomonas mobilis subsp. pomaceae]GEB89215.1 50S ribosomal protein L25 [Zymomonas mobilis subsp. pomaceae]